MKQDLRVLAAAGSLLLAMSVGEAAFAQKQGGILRMSHFDSPAGMSLHEEATAAANRPMMGVFNNLVMYKQDVPQNSMQSIVPDLAVSWSWSEEGTELTFPLRQGVKWHDGKPFTAQDVKCTWDTLTGKSENKLRLNPRKSWYRNLEEVIVNGDYDGYGGASHQIEQLIVDLQQLAANKVPTSVVVFAHGWKHTARFDDPNVRSFRLFLEGLAAVERGGAGPDSRTGSRQ